MLLVLFKFTIGIFLFILGLIFLYKSNVILNLNRIARELIFNDRIILLKRKKLAIWMFCLSFVALYMGFSSYAGMVISKNEKDLNLKSADFLMYTAMQDFCVGNYDMALQKYRDVLKLKVNNIEVLKRIAYTYAAAGDNKKALDIWNKLIQIEPDDQEIKGNLKKLLK
ncbi:tetratricopeptide repeat protein [Elusimicrobiota bacterium]